MFIGVPALKQIRNGKDMAAALSMLMKYYGNNISEKKIVDTLHEMRTILPNNLTIIPDISIETLLTGGALFARKQGYDVTCYTYNMNIFSPTVKNYTSRKLREYLRENSKIRKRAKSDADIAMVYTYRELLDLGAQLLVRPPSSIDIKNLLKNKTPFMVNVSSKIFYEDNEPLDREHSLVIMGFCGGDLFCNDPRDGKRHRINGDHLTLAMSVSAITHSAYLLAITPGKKE